MRLLRPARPSLRPKTLLLALLALAVCPAAAHAHPGHGERQLEGTVQIVHSDDFAHRRATFGYDLLAGGRRLSLRGPKGRLARLAGAQVRVSGRLRGNALSVRSLRSVRSAASGFHAISDGPRETAVLLVNFASAPAEPFTVDSAREVVFTGPASVDAYYREQSFGRVSFTGRERADGDVFGWLTIGSPTDGCPYRTWSTAARAAAQAEGVDLTGYKHVIYVFPYVGSCGWGGLGELPGDESWVNGSPSLRVIGHELGHNLGVHHANSLRCVDGAGQGLALAEGESCVQSEYGDPFSIMGNSSNRHVSAWHKAHLGWVAGAGVQTISATGTYAVWPLGWLTPGPQLLKIARGDGSFLYVDFRLPYRASFETFSANAPAVNGVTLRLAPDVNSHIQSALVDAKPKTHSMDDAPLLPGQALTDPVSGVTVSTETVNPWRADVRVTMPAGGTPPAPPSDASAPSAAANLSATTDAEMRLSWTPSADDVGVAGYWVSRDGTVVGAPTATTFADDTAAADHTYSYRVRAYDAAGNVGPETAALTVTAPSGSPDTTAPTVPGRFRALVDGTSVYLAWDPSYDAGGLSAYLVSRVGVEIGSTAGTLYIDSAVDPGRSYAYRLRTRDRAGNLSGAAEVIVALPDSPTTPPPAGQPAPPPPPTPPGPGAGWSGAALKRSWQWLRCRAPAGACSTIRLARRSSYRPTRADLGFMVRVVETAANGSGRATAASNPSVR